MSTMNEAVVLPAVGTQFFRLGVNPFPDCCAALQAVKRDGPPEALRLLCLD